MTTPSTPSLELSASRGLCQPSGAEINSLGRPSRAVTILSDSATSFIVRVCLIRLGNSVIIIHEFPIFLIATLSLGRQGARQERTGGEDYFFLYLFFLFFFSFLIFIC